MSTIDDRLEILIGKLLDGEISPSEQRWLDEELQRSDEARELLEQLRRLRECSRQAVLSQVIERGSGPEDILQRARDRQRGFARRYASGAEGRLRFAVGLAAGFVLGLLLHFVLVAGDRGGAEQTTASPTARDVAPWAVRPAGAPEESRMNYPQPVIRNIDWYSFTDQRGRQWLVEGIREGSVQPAAYYGDL